MKRVLIVDDSLELGRWLQTALTTMDAQIQATVYPSGEEALLDSSRRPVDVLITDIRLAGISGLELVRKIRKRYPGIRVIVITGMQDMSLERQANDLGIDAFFRKPMDIPSFLQAVTACLKIESPAPSAVQQPPAPPVQAPVGGPPETPAVFTPGAISSLAILLGGLRKDLGALAVLLLDENGKLITKSGDFPDSTFESRWPETLMETLRASIKVSKLLESPLPRNLIAYQGAAFDLVLSPVGNYALVLALRSGRPVLRLGLAFEEILNIQKNLLAIAVTPQAPVAPLPPSPPVREIPRVAPVLKTGPLAPPPVAPKSAPATPAAPKLVDEPPSKEFAALFGGQGGLDTQDVEDFWATAAGSQSSDAPQAPGSDFITYEQARKMGLAPGLDEDKP